MDIEAIKELFEAKLDPICADIKELKESQKEMLELFKIQARQDEAINNLKKDIIDYKNTCEFFITEVKNDVGKIKEKNDKKMWDILKIVSSATIGGLIGRFLN